MAMRDWFTRKPSPHKPVRGRTRDVVIVSETKAAEPPDANLAAETKREQVNFIQALLHMERKAAQLNTTLAKLTIQNFNGGRS